MNGFRVSVLIANPQDGSPSIEAEMSVDSAVMFSWIAREKLKAIGAEQLGSMKFQTANGIFERGVAAVGIAINGISSLTNVVIAEAGDRELIGEHTLQGLGLRFDAERQRLIPMEWAWALSGAGFRQRTLRQHREAQRL